MKFLFFCTSLEPGADGVGDYTRRLAGECAARDHDCTLVALNDPHVTRASDTASRELRVIRLPSGTPWPDRIAGAVAHVRRLAPDWVSWQLVAQGFHPRGFLPAALLQSAPSLRGPRCHVMLHELWLGLEAGSSWKHRVLGWLQRRGIVCLLDRLSPDVVQTSNATYAHVLAREGWDAGVLDLFGNVPPVPSAAGPSPAALTGVTFGTLHPQWQPAATAGWLCAAARRQRRTPALLVLGRAGAHAPAILECFQRHGVRVEATGELSAPELSRRLQSADFGIAPHPWALLGKSGAAAAMLDHGLPVLAPRDEWRLRGSPVVAAPRAEPLLARLADLDDTRTGRWLAARRAPESALPRVALTFLQSLRANGEHP
jgi:hypothetical protein